MTHINQRRDLSSAWAAANPVLQLGEVGWETDTRRSKLGDGVTAWNDLLYTVSTLVVTKADVGLANVDNTADADKPVSSAQAAAINAKVVDSIADADTTHAPSRNAVFDALALKAPLASPTFTGDPKAPTPATADSHTSIATTAFVKAAIAEKAPDVQIFTADGTWNKPAGAKYVVVEMVGGGGAGGSCGAAASAQHSKGGGGGYGSYAWKKFAASALGASETVDVGAAGAAAAAGVNNGGAGAQSTFGASLVKALGGSGGLGGSSSAVDFWVAGGAGGVIAGGVGDLVLPGENGFPANGNGSLGVSGQGASGRFGAGGQARLSAAAGQSIAGAAGTGYGAGGSGALATSTGAAAAGGAGTPGLVIVTTYFA